MLLEILKPVPYLEVQMDIHFSCPRGYLINHCLTEIITLLFKPAFCVLDIWIDPQQA